MQQEIAKQIIRSRVSIGCLSDYVVRMFSNIKMNFSKGAKGIKIEIRARSYGGRYFYVSVNRSELDVLDFVLGSTTYA